MATPPAKREHGDNDQGVKALQMLPDGMIRFRGRAHTPPAVYSTPVIMVSSSPEHSPSSKVKTEEPLPEINLDSVRGQKRNADQTFAIEEPKAKRNCLTGLEENRNRISKPFRAVRQEHIDSRRYINQHLTRFFRDFEVRCPVTAEESTIPLYQVAIDFVILPWKGTRHNGVSVVECDQNTAACSYWRATDELKIMRDDVRSQAVHLSKVKTLLMRRYETLLIDLEYQPVFSYLEIAQDAIRTLIDQKELSTARFLAKSIAYRLDREPRLMIQFDLDKDLPGLRELMEQEEELEPHDFLRL